MLYTPEHTYTQTDNNWVASDWCVVQTTRKSDFFQRYQIVQLPQDCGNTFGRSRVSGIIQGTALSTDQMAKNSGQSESYPVKITEKGVIVLLN